jgi:hypothetical protein
VPSAYAEVKPVIDAFMTSRLEQARRDGERESYDAYACDAALAAFRAAGRPAASPVPTVAHSATAPGSGNEVETAPPAEPAGTDTDARLPLDLGPDPSTPPERSSSPAPPHGPDPKIDWSVVVLVDGIALRRGWAAPGETCEIPGIGPVSVPWVQSLLPQAQVEMLVHDAVDIRAYATSTRHRPRAVELAVHVRDRDCNRPGCHRDVAELDHTRDFAATHHTCTYSLGGLCNHDHDEKTHRGAHLERHDPDWHWWPPGADPAVDPPERTPVGRHLTAWNLDHPPGDPHDPGDDGPRPVAPP